MPLLIITLVGLLAFGLFDLTLGRPLPVGSQAAIRQEIDVDPQPGEPEPTPLRAVAAIQIERCEVTDKACQLTTLYRFIVETIHGRCQLEDSIGTGNGPNRDIENEEIDRQLLYSAMRPEPTNEDSLGQRHINWRADLLTSKTWP